MPEQNGGREARDIPAPRIPVQIEQVLEVEGAYDPRFRAPTILQAHVSTPVRTKEGLKQYVLLTQNPQHGIAYLGGIDTESRAFNPYEGAYIDFARYQRGEKGVITQMDVPADQFEQLMTLDQLKAMEGIRVKEPPPQNPPQK